MTTWVWCQFLCNKGEGGIIREGKSHPRALLIKLIEGYMQCGSHWRLASPRVLLLPGKVQNGLYTCNYLYKSVVCYFWRRHSKIDNCDAGTEFAIHRRTFTLGSSGGQRSGWAQTISPAAFLHLRKSEFRGRSSLGAFPGIIIPTFTWSTSTNCTGGSDLAQGGYETNRHTGCSKWNLDARRLLAENKVNEVELELSSSCCCISVVKYILTVTPRMFHQQTQQLCETNTSLGVVNRLKLFFS